VATLLKFLRFTSLYPAYLDDFRSRFPKQANAPFDEQLTHLHADAFAWANHWSSALKSLGWFGLEIPINYYSLQHCWLREHGMSVPPKDWMLAVARLQVIDNQPDILFIDDYHSIPCTWIKELRASCPAIKGVVTWCGAPYRDSSVFGASDLVLSNIPEVVSSLRGQGLWAEHLPHAFAPISTIGMELLDRDRPFTFVGQIVPGDNFHDERTLLLEQLVQRLKLEPFLLLPEGGFGAREGFKRLLKAMLRCSPDIFPINTPWFRRLRAEKPRVDLPSFLRKHKRRPVFGRKMYEVLCRSRVTFNSHIGLSRNSASNMRLFEATGCGACLLTDAKHDLNSYFNPNTEIVEYHGVEDLFEKASWLLDNPIRAAAIGRAGRERCLRDHTFSVRAPLIHEFFLSVFR
jgi:hypothetical protein